MVEVKDAAIRKRQQIQRSSRVMFGWVAAASVVVGFAVVISWFLFQQVMFNEKVLSAKAQTVKTLDNNNKAVNKLVDELKVLETNSALNSSKINADEKALQVILDALPAESNALALGASLQNKLVSSIPGLTLDSIDINQDAAGTNDDGTVTADNTLSFSMEVSATDPNTFKELLQRFEKSIRVIDIDSLSVEKGEEKMTMKITAHAYYSPAKQVQLQKKEVKP
ncbi:MAG: hypothetical protein WAQ22_03445 [Candidatus Saccharimonas sp.]